MSNSSQNFSRVLPALFVGVGFGIACGFFIAKKGQKPTLPAMPAVSLKSKAGSPGNGTGSDSSNPGESPNSNEAKLSKLENMPVHENDGAPAAAGTFDYSTPSPQIISQIGDKTLIPGVVQDKQVDEKTHETFTTETLPDGSTANRDYREDGSIKSENVRMADGSELERSFFESGGTKAANFHKPDGSIVSASYDSTGVPSELMTTYPDHTTVFNEYDDHGKVMGVWKHYPDGRTEPFTGAENPNSP